MNFKQSLAIGKVGENEIGQWLMRRGCSILPIYEIAENQFKGPAVYTEEDRVIAPDMLVIGGGKIAFVEAKHKEAFSWHRITGKWVTGIDIHHYTEYQKVQDILGIPVWLMFLHKGGKAKDSGISPSGLFGGNLKNLVKIENHRHENWGKNGMVYWAIDALEKFADYPLTTR